MNNQQVFFVGQKVICNDADSFFANEYGIITKIGQSIHKTFTWPKYTLSFVDCINKVVDGKLITQEIYDKLIKNEHHIVAHVRIDDVIELNGEQNTEYGNTCCP